MNFRDSYTGQRMIGLFAAGAASAALGFVVLIGWYTHTVTLIQMHPALVPMQYNTAIGFLLSGLMLLALANTLIRVEIVLASLVAAIGSLTLAQYVFSVDFGIDQLLMDHYITVQTSHPGRMAPNTALAFLLIGIAALFAEVFVRHRRALVYGIFGSIVLGLGIAAALGYAMELESAYGWGRLSRMAAHTLVGFIVIGTGLFAFGWQAEKKDRVGIPRWLPIPLAVGVLTVTFVMWQALNPDRGVAAIQTAHYLVLFFGVGLAAALAFAVNQAIIERTSRKTLEIEISERIQAEEALQISEEHFRNLFENAEVSIWNEDFSEVYKALNKLRLDGVSNLRQYLEINKNATLDMATMVKVAQVNPATLKLFGAKTEKEFIESIDAVFGPDALDVFIDELDAIWGNEKTFRAEVSHKTLRGEELTVIISMPIPDTKEGFSSIPVSLLDITERKKTEEALRKSEARYSEIFNDSPIGIWEEDWSSVKLALDGLVSSGITDLRKYFNDNPDKLAEIYNLDNATNISQAACDMYRAPNKQALIDTMLAESASKDEMEGYLDCLIAFMAGETTFEYQSRDLRFDDTPITTLNRLVIPTNYRQDWSRVINAVLDITERKQVEDALRESEHSLNNAQRIAKIGNWELDIATNEIHWSDEIYRIFEIDPETFSGKFEDFFARVHPDDRGVFDQFDKAVAAKERAYNREYRIILPHGGVKTIQTHAEVIYDDQGKAIRVSGIDQDLTELRNAEEITKLSEERFRASFENVTVGSVVIDESGIIEIFNPAAEEIFGYTDDEVIGQNISLLMPEPFHSQHDSYIRDYMETGEAKVIGIGREVIGLRKNGEEFPIHLGIGKMQFGTHCSFIGSIVDLTNVKSLEKQLFHSQRMEAVGQLTGGIAHDFNNLLAVMIGNAVLLEDVAGDDEEATQSVEAIKAAVERGASLTNRLLAFSRKQVLSPEPTAINDLVFGLQNMLHRTLGEIIDLNIDATQDLWTAMIDAHQFENALVNLVLNARDAMPESGALTIETANTTLDEIYAEQHEEVTPGEYIQISVSDTGTGMPPEVLEKAFEPFFTTKEVGEGSGLGLSMVFGFVKQSKGHITIYSEVGHGTTVKLYLPRSEEDVAEASSKDEIRELARGSERILVVEDDAFVREIPVRLLRKQGYDIVEATDGKEAIQHLRDGQPFDLLFTDVILPGGMNGVEIAKEAKRIQPHIKVLYTSGYSENAVVHNGHLDSGVTVLSKPYSPEKLLEKVREMLDGEGD